eukprot:4843878-Prymnesium_polylepis.2
MMIKVIAVAPPSTISGSKSGALYVPVRQIKADVTNEAYTSHVARCRWMRGTAVRGSMDICAIESIGERLRDIARSSLRSLSLLIKSSKDGGCRPLCM